MGKGDGHGMGSGLARGKTERVAVPAMPMWMAIICCILNFLIPGLGKETSWTALRETLILAYTFNQQRHRPACAIAQSGQCIRKVFKLSLFSACFHLSVSPRKVS